MSARSFLRRPSPRQRRYRPAEKAKFIHLADRIGVAKAVAQTGVSSWSFYRWMRDRAIARSASDPDGARGLGHVPKPPRIQVPEAMQKQVLAVWRHNPGFGPSQVRNQLRRVGLRCDTKTIRKILLAHGYTPPAMKPPRSKEVRRFEASRPLELVQMDVLQFHVHGQRLYLILALDDAGGSNRYRSRLWKTALQGQANEQKIEITACHFPPGTSRWNKIEHRMFSEISKNWRGRPLASHEVVVHLIANTRTATGLEVEAKLDCARYETGTRITKKRLAAVQLRPATFHGEWNYTIVPRNSAP